MQKAEVRGAAKILQCMEQPLKTKNYPDQKVKSAKVEKFCFRVTQTSYLKEMQFLTEVERKVHAIGLTQIQ